MTNEESQPLRVECQHCTYNKIVRPTDDERPADIIIQHGRETGHKLTTTPVERDE